MTELTFLFTDLEGSTRLWEAHPHHMPRALEAHEQILAAAITEAGGEVLKATGDGVVAVFAEPKAAAQAAREAQGALGRRDWDPLLPLRVRMALHHGEAQQRGGDYFGPTLNRAARLMEAAWGGQVLCSESVREALGSEIELRDLGLHRLKDLSAPERIFQLCGPELADDFPPLRSLAAFTNNLPVLLTSFVGRERELAELPRLVENHRLVTLTGTGGSGKTRLAIQAGAEALERFWDGVWLVELAPLLDPELLPDHIALTLGLREQPGRTLRQTLVELVGGRELLLILDNCEHLIEEVAPLVEELLGRGQRLRVLATSREPLGIPGERIHPLAPLETADPSRLPELAFLRERPAIQLFGERARLVHSEFSITHHNASVVAQICHRLDGIPLAIELAAARLRVLSPEAIAARLDDRFRLLTGGARSALPRHQTLRAAIDWSYELLEDRERSLFCRLSVFSGSFSLEAAEEVASEGDLGESEVLEVLARLVDRSLVAVEDSNGESRYRLLETLRQYGKERLQPAQAEELRARHCAFFAHLAHRAEPHLQGGDQIEWLDRLDLELPNVRLALTWLIDHQPERALQMAVELWLFFDIRSRYREGLEWLERAQAASDDPPTALRARALGAEAHLLLGVDTSRALRLSQEALQLAEAAENREGVDFAHFVQGQAYRYIDQLPEAREVLERAAQTRNEWLRGWVLQSLGLGSLSEGNLRSADDLFAEAAAIFERTADPWGRAWLHVDVGLLNWFQGDLDTAVPHYEEALELFRILGEVWGMGAALIDLGEMARQKGDLDHARELLQEAVSLFRRVGHIDDAHALGNLAKVAFDQEDYDEATELLLQGLSFQRRSVTKGSETLLALGDAAALLLLENGCYEQATRVLAALEGARVGAPPIFHQDRLRLEEGLRKARRRLGKAFEQAWNGGMAMSYEEIVTYLYDQIGPLRNQSGGNSDS